MKQLGRTPLPDNWREIVGRQLRDLLRPEVLIRKKDLTYTGETAQKPIATYRAPGFLKLDITSDHDGKRYIEVLPRVQKEAETILRDKLAEDAARQLVKNCLSAKKGIAAEGNRSAEERTSLALAALATSIAFVASMVVVQSRPKRLPVKQAKKIADAIHLLRTEEPLVLSHDVAFVEAAEKYYTPYVSCVLTDFVDEEKITKVIQELLGLEMKKAKEIVKGFPTSTLKAEISRKEALEIKKKIEAATGKVNIICRHGSSGPKPMVIGKIAVRLTEANRSLCGNQALEAIGALLVASSSKEVSWRKSDGDWGERVRILRRDHLSPRSTKKLPRNERLAKAVREVKPPPIWTPGEDEEFRRRLAREQQAVNERIATDPKYARKLERGLQRGKKRPAANSK